jgi:hypothetical protein
MFVNEGLSITMAIRWPNIIKPLSCGKLQTRMRKQQWISHTLGKGDEFIQKQAVDWNPLGTRTGRPKQT